MKTQFDAGTQKDTIIAAERRHLQKTGFQPKEMSFEEVMDIIHHGDGEVLREAVYGTLGPVNRMS